MREQELRIRDELLPFLELDLRHDVEHWLADVDTAVSQFNVDHFRRLSQAVAYCAKRRNAGRTSPGFAKPWLGEREVRAYRGWVPFTWDPLMMATEQAVSEGEELMLLWDFRLEPAPVYQETGGFPPRARLWWRVVKPAAQEKAEKELARRWASRQIVPVYRKVLLVATLRARVDGWIIERLEWLDRPPGRVR